MRRSIAIVGVGALALLGSACSQKAQEQFKDAPRGARNDDPADILTFPDGFSNVSAKCDGTTRVYTVFHGDDNRASIAVSPNHPACGGSAQAG